LGLPRLVADCPEQYVNIAVALGASSEERGRVRTQLPERLVAAYGDHSVIQALEAFLLGLA
jgi:predicted O-linked N-acetylglucosamine transferase (SPINDLY family)